MIWFTSTILELQTFHRIHYSNNMKCCISCYYMRYIKFNSSYRHKEPVHPIKGTHTIYFSSSLYIINQKPMIPRNHFHRITTWVARSSWWNSAMNLLILWFQFTSQMEPLSYINFYFDCKARLRLILPGRQEKIYFCTRKFLSTR